MLVNLVFGVKLFTTLVTLILVTSWKVDVFHMGESVVFISTDLATKTALELSFVFSLRVFFKVCMQVKFNPTLISTTRLQSTILHLQCSQELREHY